MKQVTISSRQRETLRLGRPVRLAVPSAARWGTEMEVVSEGAEPMRVRVAQVIYRRGERMGVLRRLS